jgi:hypothetical protein
MNEFHEFSPMANSPSEWLGGREFVAKARKNVHIEG